MSYDIRQSASNLVDFLERNKTTEEFVFPFSHSYPRNCCESVSVLFYHLAAVKYPSAKVRIVRGINARDENHFWLEVDGLIFDLTSHQFETIQAPIIGAKTNPLADEYGTNEDEPNYDLVDRHTVAESHGRIVFGF